MRGRDRSCTCWHILWIGTTAGPEPGQTWEPGAPSRAATKKSRASGAQSLGPSSTAFPKSVQRSWNWSGTARTGIGAHKAYWHHSQYFIHHAPMLAHSHLFLSPKYFLKKKFSTIKFTSDKDRWRCSTISYMFLHMKQVFEFASSGLHCCVLCIFISNRLFSTGQTEAT